MKVFNRRTITEIIKKNKPDVIAFLPREKHWWHSFLDINEDQYFNFSMLQYPKRYKGEPIVHKQGESYSVILFERKKDEIVNVDRFSAILVEPIEYILPLIDQSFFALVCRETTKSKKFIDKHHRALTKLQPKNK